mmetsp:Transcript_98127/g.247625  ORF Transcript_98127/g.247625 Transcript_98127/m.247625 type:complete len:350 (-) Transcript_98127:52-1101(-)
MEDEWPALAKLIVEVDLAERLHVRQSELQQGGSDRHGAATLAASKLRDMQIAIFVVRWLEHVHKAVQGVRQSGPGASLADGDSAGRAMRAVVGGVEPLISVFALAFTEKADPVEHGLPIDPIDELIITKLELCWSSVDEATTQPSRQLALHPEIFRLDLLLRRLKPSAKVDANLVCPIGAIEWVYICHQLGLSGGRGRPAHTGPLSTSAVVVLARNCRASGPGSGHRDAWTPPCGSMRKDGACPENSAANEGGRRRMPSTALAACSVRRRGASEAERCRNRRVRAEVCHLLRPSRAKGGGKGLSLTHIEHSPSGTTNHEAENRLRGAPAARHTSPRHGKPPANALCTPL